MWAWIWANIVSAFGLLVTIVLAVILALWALSKYLGDKWITAKFSQQLEAFKHQQQREIEQLKTNLNTALDRKIKLQSREFDAIPVIWNALNEAFTECQKFISLFKNYRTFYGMNDGEIYETLLKDGLDEEQSKKIATAQQPQEAYQKYRHWVEFGKLMEAIIEVNKAISLNSIYVEDDILDDIKNMVDSLDKASTSYLFLRENQNSNNDLERLDEMRENGQDRMDVLAKVIKKKLKDTAALSA
ncbi:hypothetical protein BH10PLA2_BH10PLA2_01060 [soil metagenome]